MSDAITPDAYYLPSEIADYLRLSPATLEYWRRVGGGPDFVRLKNRKIRYYGQDVRTWLETLARRTTGIEAPRLALAQKEGRR